LSDVILSDIFDKSFWKALFCAQKTRPAIAICLACLRLSTQMMDITERFAKINHEAYNHYSFRRTKYRERQLLFLSRDIDLARKQSD